MAFSSSTSTSLLCFLFILSVSSITSSSPTTTTTIPLSHFHLHQSPPDPYSKLSHLVTQSISRAHHLKHPQIAPSTTTPISAHSYAHHLKHPQIAPSTTTPISAHSYGAYSIPLSFGTPPQTLQFIMDTGSDVVWFPCTHRYQCNNCSFPGSDPSGFPLFIPKLSSSVKILGCSNPKCGWIHNTNVTNCQDCKPNSKNCTQICSPYLIFYGTGTTGGFALVDTLDLPDKKVPGFVVGCSLFSSRQPAGIAGFGRSPASLPSQLGLNKFSYCLLSRKFDDSTATTGLILESGSDSAEKTAGVSYTPFVKNPIVAGKAAFSVYYYVGLRKITIGGKKVKIPYEYLSPGLDGNGGTVVDSGSTFTYMSSKVFDPVLTQFVIQTKGYSRVLEIESMIGLRPCFNVSDTQKVKLPEMMLHFKGGAEVALPLENYFVLAGDTAVCLAVLTDGVTGPAGEGGPAVILGNFQMQNFYVEYDLKNERFGLRQQDSCN